MRHSLLLQPIHNSSTDILRCFAQGKPLTSEQLNFLEWHENEISNNVLDPVIKYYLSSQKKRKNNQTFLLPHEELNHENIIQLKKRIFLFLKQKYQHIVIPLTQKQFLQFKLNNKEIIWNDSTCLLPTYSFPRITPPVLFFQWGKLFGIVKFIFATGKNASNVNILVYVKDMGDNNLKQCILEYQHNLEKEILLQKELIHTNKEKPNENFGDYFLLKPHL